MDAPRTADQAGKQLWDGLWAETEMPPTIDPRSKKLGNIFNGRMHEWFTSAIGDAGAGGSIVEVGCGRSAWLPYFHNEFGLDVCGLDYSELGCKQARALLAKARVEGEIVCADLFSPPDRMVGHFDFMVSAGVIEHFSDTAECIAACAELVKPGGTIITVLPNMAGSAGVLQRVLDKATYDIHVPLSSEDVRRAHENAGLTVIECRYLLSVGYGIARAGTSDALVVTIKRRAARVLEVMSVAVWWLEDRTSRLPTSRLFSPYVVCVARTPGTADSRSASAIRGHVARSLRFPART